MFFFFKQKTAYEMRISDWSSDVCSSDLAPPHAGIVRTRASAVGGWISAEAASASTRGRAVMTRHPPHPRQRSGARRRRARRTAPRAATRRKRRDRYGRGRPRPELGRAGEREESCKERGWQYV